MRSRLEKNEPRTVSLLKKKVHLLFGTSKFVGCSLGDDAPWKKPAKSSRLYKVFWRKIYGETTLFKTIILVNNQYSICLGLICKHLPAKKVPEHSKSFEAKSGWVGGCQTDCTNPYFSQSPEYQSPQKGLLRIFFFGNDQSHVYAWPHMNEGS